MLQKRVLLLLAMLLVGGGLLVGKIMADNQAAAVGTERQAQLQSLKQAGQGIGFSDKIIVGRVETDQELTAVNQQCAKAQAFKASVDANDAVSLPYNPFGFLSSQYKQAKTASANESSEQVKAASTALVQGCNHYVKSVAIGQDNTKFTAQKAALLSPGGTEICGNLTGCLAPENFAEYKKYFQEDINLARQVSELKSKECSFKELQKVCELVGDYYTKRLVLDTAYNKALDRTENIQEAAAYANLVFPKDEICSEVRQVTGVADITSNCSARGDQAIAGRYEATIKSELAKL